MLFLSGYFIINLSTFVQIKIELYKNYLYNVYFHESYYNACTFLNTNLLTMPKYINKDQLAVRKWLSYSSIANNSRKISF